MPLYQVLTAFWWSNLVFFDTIEAVQHEKHHVGTMLMREALAIVKNQIKILSCDEHPKCRQPLFS